MREILEMVSKIPPIIDTSISFYQKNSAFFQCQDVIYNLQMGYWWWKEASNLAFTLMEGDITKDSPPISVDYTPTLLGPREQLDFMITKSKEMTDRAIEVKSDVITYLPPRVGLWIENGISRMIEAQFNMKMIQQTYGGKANIGR